MSFWKKNEKKNEDSEKVGNVNLGYNKGDDYSGSNKGSNPALKRSLTVVVDHETEQKQKTKEKPTAADYSSLLSGLYALTLVLIGILFPLTEALHDIWNQTEYVTIFLVYIYAVGTIFIIYMEINIIRESHKHGEHSGHDHHEPHGHPHPQTTSALHPNELNASGNKLRRNGQITTEPHTTPYTHTKSKPKLNRGISAMVRYQSANSLNPHRGGDLQYGGPIDLTASNGNLLQGAAEFGSEQFGESVDEEFEMWIDVSKLGNIFSHEGSSFYLRLGALLFGIGHLIYISLEIENSTHDQPGCPSSPYWWTYIVRLVFVVVQTFFLFKNPSVHIHKHEPLARFGFSHLIATNMCVWIRTLINEIMEEYHHLHSGHGNSTDHHIMDDHVISAQERDVFAAAEGECTYHRGILQVGALYLFPFVLEYSLIAMGTIAIIYDHIDQETKDTVVRGLTNFFKVQSIDLSGVEQATDHHEEGGDHHGPSVLAKSHTGTFVGILVMAGSVISIILFFFAKDSEHNQEKAELIFLSTDLAIHSLLLIAAVLATVQIHQLSYIAKPMSIDDIFLYISMAGTILLEISVVIASGDALTTNDPYLHRNMTHEALRLSGGVVDAVQTLMQVILILSGMRRYPSKAFHVTNMPGRGLLTFLIVGNVTVWIFRTMQAKEMMLQETQSYYYGDLAWLLLMNINLPLLLFFRFHSSICLADVWAVAYAPLHQKVPKKPQQNHQSDAASHAAATADHRSASRHSNALIRSVSVPQLYRPSSVKKLDIGNAILEDDAISDVNLNASLKDDAISDVKRSASLKDDAISDVSRRSNSRTADRNTPSPHIIQYM